MYLSRLILNPRSRQVQSELARPYEMHRTLLRGFPNGKVHAERTDPDAVGMLFRVDEDPGSGRLHLLVQSQQPPQWGFLAETGYLLPDAADNPATREVNLQPQAGQMFAFRLRANPTKRLSAGKGNKGKRVGIYDEEDQFVWLACKGEQHGFRLLQSQISRDGKVVNEKAIERTGKEHKLELFTVQFDGALQVTDPIRFSEALAGGIGSGKAFGCGLLSIAPAR